MDLIGFPQPTAALWLLPSFAAASVVLRARTNTDRVTQISPEMVLAATVKFANDKQPLVLYMSSSFWLLGVESRDFSQAEKERKKVLPKLNKFTKDNYFQSKRQPRTILSENSCHFVN